jgi:hypothetical protein
MTRLQVDFNSLHEGLVGAMVHDAEGPIRLGEPVLLEDSEGNRAAGEVRRMADDVALVAVDWATWRARTDRTVKMQRRPAKWSNSAPETKRSPVRVRIVPHDDVTIVTNNFAEKVLA